MTRLFALIAGDSVLCRKISSADAALLQDDLDALQLWESRWLMRFNATKCQVCVTNKRKAILANYTIHDSLLYTFVRPIVEYASVTWDPYTQHNINKIEQVQHNSARFVFNDCRTYKSVSTMITDQLVISPKAASLKLSPHHVQDIQQYHRHPLETTPITINF